MKYTARIPTKEYAFIEIEGDNRDEILEEYHIISSMMMDKEGLNQNQWAKVRNNYFHTGELDPGDVEAMSKAQRFVINEMKLAIRSVNK